MRAGGTDAGTERCQELERKLERSERRLADSQRLARVGSWEWDLTQMRSTWSQELLRIFGRDPAGPQPSIEELVAAVHPEDREGFEGLVARVRSCPGPFQHSYRIVGPDGEARYLQARGDAIGDADGKPIRAFGTTQDVTELKRSEHALELRVKQQAGVAALGRYALSAPNLQAVIDEAVRMVASVLGVELVEVLELSDQESIFRIKAGVGWEPGTVGRQVPADCAQMRHAIEEGMALVADYESETRFAPLELLRRHRARSGIAAAIEGADQAYGTIGAHSTEVRRFSPDDAHFLQAVGNVLGATIDRNHAEQVEAQLEQAKRLEAVGQLAGGVAHDFNNLLLVILSYTECLIAEGPDEPLMANLREIERAARTAAEVTRQLLQFSRRESSGPIGVDLVAAVRDTESLLRRTIGEHVALSVDAPAGLSPVALGRGQVNQILINLVVNARDALPGGGSIAVTVRDEDEDCVALVVADDGEGMSEEVRAQAFDPFFTTKPRGQGTGLGLATVYGIVKNAGGSVEIESEPGEGTAVRVYLPVAEEPASTAPERRLESADEGAGRTVLVVDNDGPVRTVVLHMLRRQGYRAIEAGDGVEAQEILDKLDEEVDVLLTDVQMPGMSGAELARRVRDGHSNLGVIFMSGYSGDGAGPLGAWDEDAVVLEKPFTPAQLLQAMAASLS